MKKFLLITLSLIVASQCAQAKQISADEAMRNATQFARSSSRLRSIASNRLSLAYTEKADGNNVIYVFNSAGTGFVVTAADDCAAPVLGYSETGTFNPANMPPAMKDLFAQYSAEISAAIAAGCEAAPATAQTDTRKAIAPIVTAKWGQDEPFNNLCPEYTSGIRSVTGCAATAMAQIMNSYSWPETGTGSNEYSIYLNGASTTLSLDFSETTFDWANMTDEYTTSSSEAEKNAVATLMYNCGVATEMYYGFSSSTTLAKCAIAYANYFGYDKSIATAKRCFYSNEEWNTLIYNELAKGYPVQMEGYASDGSGHTFVCDGYSKNNYFHINWGWNGGSNGYFLLSGLNPYKAAVNAEINSYNRSQGIIYNIRKDQGGSFSHTVGITGNFVSLTDHATTNSTDKISFQTESIVYLSADPDYYGIRMIAKVVNNETQKASYIYSSLSGEVAFYPGTYTNPMNFYGSDFSSLADGTYTVTPAYYNSTARKYYDIEVAYGHNDKFTLTKSGTDLTFSNPDASYAQLTCTSISATKFYTGKGYQITAKLKNTGTADFCGYITPVIKSSTAADASTIAEGYASNVQVNAGEEATVTFSGNLDSETATGNYVLQLTYSDHTNTVTPVADLAQAIEVKTSPGSAVFYTADPVVANSDHVTATNINVSAKVTCSSGYFFDYVQFLIFAKDDSYCLATQQSQLLSLEAGESGTATATLSLPDLTTGTEYKAEVYSSSLTKLSNNPAWFTVTQIYTGISETEDNGGYTVYPSPATDVITVTAPALITAVEIYSTSGQKVSSQQGIGSSKATVSVDGLAPGIYVVKTITSEGAHVSRIAKQ